MMIIIIITGSRAITTEISAGSSLDCIGLIDQQREKKHYIFTDRRRINKGLYLIKAMPGEVPWGEEGEFPKFLPKLVHVLVAAGSSAHYRLKRQLCRQQVLKPFFPGEILLKLSQMPSLDD